MAKKLKIVLTGGHAATPGLATSEGLWAKYGEDGLDIYWIGAKKAIEGGGSETLEYRTFPKLGIKFVPICTGKLQTKFTRYTIASFLKIPVGFIQSFFVLLKIKPDIIVSFGGYASFPVVFWGWVFRIPILLHEQTMAAGRAAVASAFFAKKIALSRKESVKYFPREKVVITGNPLMSSILNVPPPSTTHLSPVTILVMGGSRGSEFINKEFAKIAAKIVKKYKVIQITGERDYEKYKDLKGPGYEIFASVNPLDMAGIYSRSDIIISRSGANSVSEILKIKRPAILIPLPRTYMAEQVKNAEYAKKFGLAKVMLETEVNSASLLNEIDEVSNDWTKIIKSVQFKLSPDRKAVDALLSLIASFI